MTGYDMPCSWCGKTLHEIETKHMQMWAAKKGQPISIGLCSDCIAHFFIEQFSEQAVHALSMNFLGIKPYFKQKEFKVRLNHCFYLGPFAEPFSTIYVDHICKAVHSIGCTIERADEIYGTKSILEDIWVGINSSSIIVAELSGRNANVMYEIGISHTIGKPVILVTQNLNDVPFDLQHLRCIIYDYTPRGCQTLEKNLKNTITSVIKDRKIEE